MKISAGENETITNRHHRPMLSPGCFFAAPHTEPPTELRCSIIHSRYNVAAAAAVVMLGTMLSPGAGTSAAIKRQINIVHPAGVAAEYLKPVGANLSYLITPAFSLNFFGVSYVTCHQ